MPDVVEGDSGGPRAVEKHTRGLYIAYCQINLKQIMCIYTSTELNMIEKREVSGI